MSVYCVFPATREQPAEFAYSNPVYCLSCAGEYDCGELIAMGSLYLCPECQPMFTCDWCGVTTLEPLNRSLDGLCAQCVIRLAELEAA